MVDWSTMLLVIGAYAWVAVLTLSMKRARLLPAGRSLLWLFMAGAVVFQVVSPLTALLTGELSGFHVNFPDRTARAFAFDFLIFFCLFLPSYALAIQAGSRDYQEPVVDRLLIDVTPLYVGTVVFVIAAAVFVRFTFRNTPLDGFVGYGDVALFVVAAFLSGWLIQDRRLPLQWILFLTFLMVGVLVVVQLGTFGRRPMLGVVLGFVIGLIWDRRLRDWSLALVPGILGLLLLGAITDVREHASVARERTFSEWIDSLQGADPTQGLLAMAEGQDAGAASFWLIENGKDLETVLMFQSLWYPFVQNVPRSWWEEKPIVLSHQIHYYAGFRPTFEGTATRSTGLVGQPRAEGGTIALIVYALVLGAFFGRLDHRLIRARGNPLCVAIFVSTVPWVIGLPRGDIGMGLWRILASLLFAWGIFTLVRLIVAKFLIRIRSHVSDELNDSPTK